MNMENCIKDINPIKLDDIVNFVLDKADSQLETHSLDFVKCSEQMLMAAIRKYTLSIKEIDFSDVGEQQIGEVIENISTDLLDQVTQINRDYFLQGIRIGAKLLLELVT